MDIKEKELLDCLLSSNGVREPLRYTYIHTHKLPSLHR